MDSPRVSWVRCFRLQLHFLCTTPAGMGNEVRAIVHPQMGRWWIHTEQLLDRVNGLAPSSDANVQTVPAVFIRNIQKHQSATIHCLIELEGDGPHVVRVLDPKLPPGAVSGP
jgi:hypothetical protein